MVVAKEHRNRGGRPKRRPLERRMYSISDIVDVTGCSRDKIELMIRERMFKTAVKVGRIWLVSIDEVDTLFPPRRR